MSRSARLLVAVLVLAGILLSAPYAAAAPLGGAERTAPTAEACEGPCPVFVYTKGAGSGSVWGLDDEGLKPCPRTSQCTLTLYTAADVFAVTIQAKAEEGSYLARWENCDATSPDGRTCTLNFLRSDFVCVSFERVGSPPTGLGCPPAPSEPPPPPPDTVAPNSRITAAPPRSTRSRRATFRFTSTEPGSRFICKLDARPWFPCRSPKTYSSLKRGFHTFRVRAIDLAGNMDATPAVRRWRIS